MEWPLKVAELFAGVGGFRLGLEAVPGPAFKCEWSNQWEPGASVQHASRLYVERFGPEGHSNKDIATVDAVKEIPDIDMLVGGFPCQDYSVARVLSQAAGLVGKKGVLWWQIHRILAERGDKAPKVLFLENVDRLLKSPASQRGRDFAVMLASLADLGYAAEWRVINAADYGFPQRRRRVYLLAYHASLGDLGYAESPNEWILSRGPMARAFPVQSPADVDLLPSLSQELDGDLAEVTQHFNKGAGRPTPFLDTGIMVDRKVWTYKTKPDFHGKVTTLGEVLEPESRVPAEYYLAAKDLAQWKYLKGAKRDPRVHKESGFKYTYNEGPMAFPDPLDRPARTIVTGEGGSSPSRFKHVVEVVKGKKRRLLPVELERLNGFRDNHTAGIPDTRRAFLMGNALVVGVVERIGRELAALVRPSKTTQPVSHADAHVPA